MAAPAASSQASAVGSMSLSLSCEPTVTVGAIKQQPGFFTKGIANKRGDIVMRTQRTRWG